tara:strand:- start:576 stop:707 length:132 start_codon:yes stop_codon:yes gene_type:complete
MLFAELKFIKECVMPGRRQTANPLSPMAMTAKFPSQKFMIKIG